MFTTVIRSGKSGYVAIVVAHKAFTKKKFNLKKIMEERIIRCGSAHNLSLELLLIKIGHIGNMNMKCMKNPEPTCFVHS